MEKTNSSKCDALLTVENAYKYNGYKHKQCKKCRNAHVKMLYRKRAKALKEAKWF